MEDYLERNQDDFDEFSDVASMYESLNLEALLEKSAALCVPLRCVALALEPSVPQHSHRLRLCALAALVWRVTWASARVATPRTAPAATRRTAKAKAPTCARHRRQRAMLT